MSLDTAATLVHTGGKKASAPMRAARISFPGDASYSSNGTPNFSAFVQTCLKERITKILDVIPGDCGDNKPEYDYTNDKLKVRVISSGAEVAGAVNLSGTTFNMTVLFE